MTTTIERYQGTRAHNYCTLPTIDVEIVEMPLMCEGRDFIPAVPPERYGKYSPDVCHKELIHDGQDSYGWSKYAHADGSSTHHVSVGAKCTYCGNTDPTSVHSRQHAWYDAVECDRCGGVNGWAIGD